MFSLMYRKGDNNPTLMSTASNIKMLLQSIDLYQACMKRFRKSLKQLKLKTLKTCKATGNDFLLNEYFIEGIDILSSHVCDLFNSILNSGYFPGLRV